MTRNKVKLEFITNDSARKATFNKRKKGLFKKVSELTTLCGVDACAIIYSPYAPSAEVWPSQAGAHSVLKRFKNLSQDDQGKKMLDQEKYLKQRIAKAEQLLEKLKKNNREKEINNIMYECLNGTRNLEGLNLEDTMDLCMLARKTSKEINERIVSLEKNAGDN
ncbi:agamous-like MADS-box protein AGL80 [Chenopodium quinoa]|uniref:agamous-like MADS-box protein AGL80 n=1 Tax=Chenopodium quinoa TaxID=63459 RepID=UPI000B78EA0E|nr:agamous-like MADS-box protein AGL80 [Chenopodium quinoa]